MLECKNLVKFCRKHYIPPLPPLLNYPGESSDLTDPIFGFLSIGHG